jgi:hypothetical protein
LIALFTVPAAALTIRLHSVVLIIIPGLHVGVDVSWPIFMLVIHIHVHVIVVIVVTGVVEAIALGMVLLPLLSVLTIVFDIDVDSGAPSLDISVEGSRAVVLMIDINVHAVVVVVGMSTVDSVALWMVILEPVFMTTWGSVHIDINSCRQGSLQSASEEELLEQHFQNA